MPLEHYQRKRNFRKTSEPAGGPVVGGATRAGRYVVQRHRATRLHYDFRLEIDGVLVSWAVPKGPTLDPSVRRMAVHVEDHPIEYFDFEGVIPKGEYGGGDVIVWDWGQWTAESETPDGRRGVEDGELKFTLAGEKLRGRFTIVRTSGRGAGSARAGGKGGRDDGDGGGEQWLLLHKKDDAAVEGWDAEDFPQSVKTGRTNDEVKDDRDAIWISKAPAAVAEIDLSAATDEKLPAFIEPMAATLTANGFRDDDWLFEIKWDGYRVEAVVSNGTAKVFTRNGNDAETYFPKLLTKATWIDAKEAIVDGEVVAIGEDGRPDFSLLQEATGGGSTRFVYQAFDLLYLDGRSLLKVPLESRKQLLRSVLRAEDRRVRFADHVVGEGLAFLEAAKAQELEGMIAKHRRSIYEPGRRTRTWLKIKIRPEQELVVGGWTPGEGAAKELGAVVVGFYETEDGKKKLRFAGKVGSGFTAATRKKIRERLAPLEIGESPFDPPPPKDYKGRWGGELSRVVWVDPQVVIRAELGGWTRDGIVRQAAFKGFDEGGKKPTEVVREQAVATKPTVDAADEAVDAAEAAIDAALAPSAPEPVAPPQPTTRDAGGVTTQAKQRTSKPASKAAAKGPATTHEFEWSATASELAALDAMTKDGPWSVGGFELKLTNLDKVLFKPRADDPAPVTKRDLIRYFAQIAPTMLAHLADRPLNMQRFPNGADGPSFWQKDIPSTAPDWLRRWKEVGVAEREANDHLIADRVGALCWLGNQASFEVHAWTSKIDDPMTPTFALIDIDPGTKTTWDETLTLARLYRTALEHLGVRGYPKTTGKRGIQVWIPIERKYTFRDTSDWVEQLSRAVGATVPDLVSWEWSKSNRGGKARLDYTQNTYIKTLVAPYAVRPADGAPVSTPITWDELDDPDLRSDRWTVRTVIERVAKVGDLFAGAQTDAQELPKL
ncbi:MAG TPA: DNA ligase D [Candidatus Limnocylindrales bacterium]|nr:DNA ligase D [Candidatus Limnocylindrales bacterium]